MKPFDVRDIADEGLKPILQQLHEFCEKNRIPYIAHFCVKGNEDGTYESRRSAFMDGPDRSPQPFMLAHLIASGGVLNSEENASGNETH